MINIFQPIHCNIKPEDIKGNNGKGRIFFIPGSKDRASLISSDYLIVDNIRSSPRGHHIYIGKSKINNIDIGVVSTGMGCPSLDIIVSELILTGAKHFIRIGTAGSLNTEICPIGNIIIATGAVRDEGTSKNYAPIEVPAVPNFDLTYFLKKQAIKDNIPHNIGILHTKDSLFVREYKKGFLAAESELYMNKLKNLGILASEMESSHLFILGSTYNVNTASVCSIIGGESDEPFSDKTELIKQSIKNAINITIKGISDYLNYLT